MVAQAVDLVIQLAEEGEMAFFGRRNFADYFAVRKAHFLRVPLGVRKSVVAARAIRSVLVFNHEIISKPCR